MNKVTKYLSDAKAIIATPDKWAKKSYAFNDKHEVTSVFDPSACRFCMLGAIKNACKDDQGSIGDCYIVLTHALGKNTNEIASFNDSSRTAHIDVLAAFDTAIEYSKSV